MAKEKGEYLKSNDNMKVINPYTFIPITPHKEEVEKRVNADVYYETGELHSGVLQCSLQVVTPLAIPDTSEEENNTYKFYKQEGKTAIPGSSIRGMIRAAYETVTDSCFSTVKKDTPLSFRVEARNAYSPGIFIEENGRYCLYKADRSLLITTTDKDDPSNNAYIKTVEHSDATSYSISVDISKGCRQIHIDKEDKYLKTGDSVWIETVPSKHKKGSRYVWEEGGVVQNLSTDKKRVSKTTEQSQIKNGILFLGELNSKKHGESVFVKKSDKPIDGCDCPVKADNDSGEGRELALAYEKLKKTLDIYRGSENKKLYKENEEDDSQKSHRDHRGYPNFENLDPKKGIPVWYKIEDNKIYLSYAAIGRSMYERTLNDLLGELNPCTDRSQLCEACLLFGMVSGSNQEKSMGSRIRITDAYLDCKDFDQMENDYVVLKELGMPRYSYLPFYAKKDKGGVLKSYDEDGGAIAGRKFYWNNIIAQKDSSSYKVDPDDIVGTKAESRTIKIELLPPGALFTFNIYYDGITEDQLQKLIWVLTIGKNDLPKELPYDIDSQDDLYCHKLGRGKPLGLGSVKIVVNENWEREWGCTTGNYCLVKQDIDKRINVPKGLSIAEFSRVTSMRYPLDKDNIETGIKIDYPNILDKDNSIIPLHIQQKNNHLARHQWYSKNKEKCNQGKGETLPKITDKDQTLYQYCYVETTYSAKVLKKIESHKNPNFTDYLVEIQGGMYQNKKCIASVRNSETIKIGETINVILFKEFPEKAIFNLEKR